MEEVNQPTIRVFYSYAHEDMPLRNELEKHLATLKRQGYISHWSDRDISAGKEWQKEIDENLGASDIILLLVSPDFIHSDYCYGVEMKLALERHKAEEARAVPIILRPVDWEEAPFSNLQALPTDARPITTWPNRDEAFFDVAKGIRKLVKELLVEKYLEIAEELYDEDQYEKALILYEHAIRLDSTAHKTHRLKMHLLTDLERYEEALMASQQVINLIPNDADLYDDKAFILLKLNRPEEALDALEKAKNLEPLESLRYASKGDALFSLARYKEALDCYQQAIDILSPDEGWVYSKYKGNALFELGRYEEAIAAYTKYSENVPDGNAAAEVLKSRGDAFFKLGRYEEALASYGEAEKELEDFYGGTENDDFRDEAPSCIKGKGDALLKLGRYEEALAAYHQTINLAPNSSENYEGIAETLLQLNHYEEALTFYDQAIKLIPNKSILHIKKAGVYHLLYKQTLNKAFEIGVASNEFTIETFEIYNLLIENSNKTRQRNSEGYSFSLRLRNKTYLNKPIFFRSHDCYIFNNHDKITIYESTNKSDKPLFYIFNHTQNFWIKLTEQNHVLLVS